MARAWHLKSRPQGMPTADNFELRDIDAAAARRRHDPRPQPLALGRPLHARADERREELRPAVPARRADGRRRGRRGGRKQGRTASRRATSCCTWPAGATRRWSRRARPTSCPISAPSREQFLGILGTTGATAYFGLLDAASAKEGDIVFVSAAAGAVGSAVVQIAKAKGMTVIGSAGGKEKCDYVRSLGADHVDRLSRRAAPQGPRRRRARRHRRLFRQCRRRAISTPRSPSRATTRASPICGMIEGYNQTEPTSLRFLTRIIAARIRLQGLPGVRLSAADGRILPRHGRLAEERRRHSRGRRWSRGSSRRPTRSSACSSGANTGKMLVQL